MQYKELETESNEAPLDASVNGNIFSWNTTSLEPLIFLVAKISTLYPFVPNGYLTKMWGVVLGTNLSLWILRIVGITKAIKAVLMLNKRVFFDIGPQKDIFHVSI